MWVGAGQGQVKQLAGKADAVVHAGKFGLQAEFFDKPSGVSGCRHTQLHAAQRHPGTGQFALDDQHRHSIAQQEKVAYLIR